MPIAKDYTPTSINDYLPASQRQHAHVKPRADASNKVVDIRGFAREVDMLPKDWAEVGNPTPYELRVSIETCKRLWKLNKAALECLDCDHEVTEYNIKVLEKLYINLMDYLVE
ncbi:MAG: hypothetical protein JXK16_13325 [Thiotrichales bacterium]|nr:hypothetical protein [Thiotrichales bacterium]